MQEYQNIKIFLQNTMLQVGQKKLKHWLKQSTILYRGHMLLVILKVKKLFERFMKNNCKKQNKKYLGWKKLLKEKVTKYISNGKVVVIHLIVRLKRKT